MIIIGKEGCPRCKEIRASFSFIPYIEIPDIHMGVGDTICAITCFLGITPCHACRIRQSILNKWFPYKSNIKKIDSDLFDLKQKLLSEGVKEFPIIMDKTLSFIVPMKEFLDTYQMTPQE